MPQDPSLLLDADPMGALAGFERPLPRPEPRAQWLVLMRPLASAAGGRDVSCPIQEGINVVHLSPIAWHRSVPGQFQWLGIRRRGSVGECAGTEVVDEQILA